jgi:hypothetical protein
MLVVVLDLHDIGLYDIAIVGVALFVVEKHFGLEVVDVAESCGEELWGLFALEF